MPRKKPFRCRRCGQLYVTARCPDCYPKKGRSVRSRMNGSSPSSRPRSRRLWGRGVILPVHPYDHSEYTDGEEE